MPEAATWRLNAIPPTPQSRKRHGVGAGRATVAGMSNIGPMELIIVLVIALIVLGPKKLPEVGRSIGKGMREFKESLAGETHDDEEERPALKSE